MNKKSGQKDEVKRELGRPGIKWKENIEVNLRERDVVGCINLIQDSIRQLSLLTS
jgi:hypothetical protein